MDSNEEPSLIVFFDLETTLPSPPDQRRSLLEFGAIVVCPRTLAERDSLSRLVRPTDLSSFVDRHNGITRDALASAPTFLEIADQVYRILHGRIWAGHNIVNFDCILIREAFEEVGLPAPRPNGIIDSLELLREIFGRRARDTRMATLAAYFELGQQTHRSLDDVRMNLEIIRRSATVLFLESHIAQPDQFDENLLIDQMDIEGLPAEANMEGGLVSDSPRPSFSAADFLEPEEVSIPSISAFLIASFRNDTARVLHRDAPLQLYCRNLRVRYGISPRYHRPVSFVVDPSFNLCQVLDVCEQVS